MPTLAWEDELPVAELPDDPAWRENFCFDGYDKDRDVGFWIHCARWRFDPRIWREQVLLYIPGGDYLVHRAWGVRPNDRGPSSALLDLICDKPGEAWRIKYRGPTRRTTLAETMLGPLPEGPQILLDLDIAFTSKVPMWDMSAGIKDQDWGKFHIEQTGSFLGDISWGDGERVRMDGFGWHDHSRGPRDLSKSGRHAWIHGDLSNNRSFALTFMENGRDGAFEPVLGKVVIWEDGKIFEGVCHNPPFLTSTAVPSPTYAMTLEYERGKIEVFAEARRALPHSTSGAYDCFDGVAPEISHKLTFEQGTVFTVDGQQFNGHTERSFRF